MKLNNPLFPVLCGAGLYFFANIQRVAIPGSVFNELQRDFSMSAPLVTGLGSVFMYLYAVNQLFAGMLNDRFGGMRVVLYGAIPFCIGSVLFPLSDSTIMLYTARVLSGIGASMIYLSLVTEILRHWHKSGGVGISFLVMFGFIGGILANAPFTYLAVKIGYRNVLLGAGVLTCLLYLLFVIGALQQPHPAVSMKTGVIRRFKNALSNPMNLRIFFMTGLNFGLYYVIQTVLGKKFLEDCCGYSAAGAAWILSIMGLFSALCGMVLAVFCRTNAARVPLCMRTAGSMLLIVFPLTGILLAFNRMTGMIGILFCMLAMTSSLSSITIPFLADLNGRENSGTCAALLNFCFYSSVAIFGNIAGSALNMFPAVRAESGYLIYPIRSYLLVFGILSVFAVISFTLSLRIRANEK